MNYEDDDHGHDNGDHHIVPDYHRHYHEDHAGEEHALGHDDDDHHHKTAHG